MRHGWSATFGDGAREEAREVAVDSEGNVYVAGAFARKIDLGGGASPLGGRQDVLLLPQRP